MDNKQVPKADSKFQKIARKNHRKWKLRLLSKGGQKADSGGSPYKEKPDYNRAKSAPPGFGGSLEETEQLNEVIRKKDGKYCLFSKKSKRNLGCYPTRDGALKRERQVQYFKHLKEEIMKALIEVLEEKKSKGKDDRCVRIAKRKYRSWPSAYACVPEKSSKALTKDGWKSVDELSLNEEILTFNLEKDILEFKPVLNIHRYKDAQTQIVRSGNNGFIFESTKNHKWVIKLPEAISERKNKYDRINNMTLVETEVLLQKKNKKSIVVSAPYDGGESIRKNKIYKYGDNWIKYILEADQGQRQAWLFSAIVYDGNQQKIERLTENNSMNELEWGYDGKNDKQSFGFKQKDIMHRDAFLLSAFLNQGLVTWKKVKDKEIYSCHYSSNKRYKNAENLKIVTENVTDVWCPETENNTWVMMQETNGNGIITITGNSGAVVKCRQGKIWKDVKEEGQELDEEWSEKYKRSIDCKNPKGFSQKAHCQGRKKNEEVELEERKLGKPSSETNLGDWFKRKGAPGKTGGWVDCNTCKDGKCKPCGRQVGEKRSKYPRCRPTPSQCKGYKRRGDNLQKEEQE